VRRDNLCRHLCKHDYSSNLEGQCRVESSPNNGDVNASLGTLGNVQSKGVDFGVNPLEIQLAILTSNIVLERVRAVDPEKSLYSNLGSYKKIV